MKIMNKFAMLVAIVGVLGITLRADGVKAGGVVTEGKEPARGCDNPYIDVSPYSDPGHSVRTIGGSGGGGSSHLPPAPNPPPDDALIYLWASSVFNGHYRVSDEPSWIACFIV
jgi:hypothetical protein